MLSRELLKVLSTSRFVLYRRCVHNRKQFLRTCNNSLNSRLNTFDLKPPDRLSSKNCVRFYDSVSETSIDPKHIASSASTTVKDPSKMRFEKVPMNNEEFLEKLIAGLSADIHMKNRVYKNDLKRVIAKVKAMNFSTKKQQLLLLRCCTDLLVDEAPITRMNLAEEVWTTIRDHTIFELEHYNELLRVYIANNRTVVAHEFITKMGDVKPDQTTYELLLKVLAEAGDINQATEVLSNMKAQNLPVTEHILHSLIVCQGKVGSIKNIQEVLTMMTSLKLEHTADTHVAVARALAYKKNRELLLNEMEVAYQSGVVFEERHIMEIVKTLAAVGMMDAVQPVLKYLPETTLHKPSISPYMQSVATQLVFQNHPVIALELYKCLPLPSFGPKDDKGLHGRSLVRDCVKACVPSSVIGLITQELMATGRNPLALHNAAEAALQQGKSPLALDMLTRLKQLGMPLRPHYFWPILVQSAASSGEKGIFNTLRTMDHMDVTPDYETIIDYCIPYVSFTSPQNLMKKFLDTGVNVSVVLTPMMETLLKTGQVRAASELCELFQGKIDGEKLIKPLLKGYLTSLDLKNTVHILEDLLLYPMDKTKDWTGRFLCHLIRQRRGKGEFTDFMTLLKAIVQAKLKISHTSADFCIQNLPADLSDEKLNTVREYLVSITDERLMDDGELFTHGTPHPKNMNEEALRAHLAELEAKGMNTRGVLRRLLQEYSRSNNLHAAMEIVEKCKKENMFLSAGMKALIFDLNVRFCDLDNAELALADLNKTAPNFLIDEFKIIDFATLMVYRDKIDKAFELIKEQSKKRNIVGGNKISMNCWRLLDSVAAHGTYKQTHDMFHLLTSLGYCKPNNIILGPLVRAHLKNNNLEEAVNEFARLASTYNKTPLKHELLCKIISSEYSDGYSEGKFTINEKGETCLHRLAQTVLNINKKIYGLSDVYVTLIAALADVGHKRTLRKVLLDPKVKFHPDALRRRCERFADERKVKALETLAECARDVRHIDVIEIYDLVLDVYQRQDDCDNALKLFTKLQDEEVMPSHKFLINLYAMLKATNKQIPGELALVLKQFQDKAQAKKEKEKAVKQS